MIRARCGYEQMNLGNATNVIREHDWTVSGQWADRECENIRNWAINTVFKILHKTEERKSYWLIYLHTVSYKRGIGDDKYFRRHAVQDDWSDWHTFCVTLCIWTMVSDVSNDLAAFETPGTPHLMTQRHFSQDLYRRIVCI